MRPIVNLITAAILAMSFTAAATAATGWSDKPFVYRAEGKKLADVLQDFAASQLVPVSVDPGVEGTVNASFNAKAEDVLKAISKTYNVIWYFDGVTLFVYPSKSMQSRVFRLRGFDPNQVRQMLSSFGLGDSRFPLRYNEAEQTLLAYGPPRHIEVVAAVIDTLEQGSKERGGNAIRVVPLRYAVAGDRLMGTSRVPGLASTLNQAFNGGAGAPQEGGDSGPSSSASMVGAAEKQRAAEMTYGFKPRESDSSTSAIGRINDSKDRGAGKMLDEKNKATVAEKPYFQADVATNSILINSPPERVEQYVRLVQQLDVAQNMVEIEATIIDVSTDEFDSLGIEWDFTRTGRGRITVSPGTPGTLGSTSTDPSSALTGANITTIVSDAGRALLTRIRALEGTGKARILARPKVLGSANRTATMVDKRIASVRVAGNLDANLFTLEAGTTLQVQPQIVAYPDHREVKLTLFIQDGNFESAAVDQVPIIKRTEISTEAVMREGESLLIGGISVESDFSGRSGLPYLSRIPVLGAAFRHDEGSKVRSERLFLLTPKVLDVAGARAPELAAAVSMSNALPAPPALPLPVQPSAAAKGMPAPPPQALPQAAPQATPVSAPVTTAPAPASTAPAQPAAAAANEAAASGACAASALGLSDAGCSNSAPAPR
jgi:type III secretion protein C